MSGSDENRWGRAQSETAGNSVHQEHATDHSIPQLAGAVRQLQARLNQMAEELSTIQTHVKQTGINAEEAITAALEDILARLDRGVETSADDKLHRALAQLQEAVNELAAKSDRQNAGDDIAPAMARIETTVNELAAKSERQNADDDIAPGLARVENAVKELTGRQGGGDELGPVLTRVETTVNELAAQAELDQDMLDAVTRIESALTALADEGRYERRSLVVRLDQLVETVQTPQADAGPPPAGDQHQLIEKLDRLAEMVESLRRRLALPAQAEPVTLSDSSVSAVGEAVTGALASALTKRTSATGGRDDH
jgi:chromosome segregation ATPase